MQKRNSEAPLMLAPRLTAHGEFMSSGNACLSDHAVANVPLD